MLMDQKRHPGSSSTTRRADERKFIERNRRNQMKDLYCKLNSLVPHQRSRECNISQPDQLEEATNYIKKLQINLEKMKEKKNTLVGIDERSLNVTNHEYCRGKINNNNNNNNVGSFKFPQIEIRQVGLALEVVLITGQYCHQFMFTETIRVLHEEGAEIVNASYKVVEHAVFHTAHCQVGESGNGITARISDRLNKFVCDQ